MEKENNKQGNISLSVCFHLLLQILKLIKNDLIFYSRIVVILLFFGLAYLTLHHSRPASLCFVHSICYLCFIIQKHTHSLTLCSHLCIIITQAHTSLYSLTFLFCLYREKREHFECLHLLTLFH